MDERRKHLRVIARIPCDLLVAQSGWHFSGFTRNLSSGGVEFEATESMVRPGHAVASGSPGILTFLMRRQGVIQELKFPCRLRYIAANIAGVEFTVSYPTPEQRSALARMLESRSNVLD
jgi:hypothetical protein